MAAPGSGDPDPHPPLHTTMQMIAHSKAIALVLLIDMLALLMYNLAGMCVTGAPGQPAWPG